MSPIIRPAISLFALIAATISCIIAAARAEEIAWKVEEATAQRLAAEGDHGAATGLEFFDNDSNISPPFFVYHGLTKPPVEGSFGYFAVNPWTGVVGMPQIVDVGLAQIAGGDPPALCPRRAEAIRPAPPPQA